MAKIKRKAQQATLLIVGEGQQDKAFIKHMKSLYDDRNNGQHLTIHSADGGSPNDIIKATQRKYLHADYDRSFILMDSDIPVRQQDWDLARKSGIELILSTPLCLEGMLLDVLNQKVPANFTSTQCKATLRPYLSGEPVFPGSYNPTFDKAVLDASTKAQIIKLRQLISHLPTK
ncbi:MAG: hypothetical protein KJ556_06710 [Gammaproteobacteria bacterium]|nr:hypothetical protein [Gammaproteobacteria bacterium]MBU2059039.1 hypothetical protein [Gammaproteobacteria bacterium]MBU2174801.1 hypothetical protein [Gammaproteobacteria bacterium]MBU2245752.1 hypothetical protein [Gammaproteobacteria bacterium]MBU2343233.1 hypothetical protein [Gammaproteobacteria bacterium]